MMDTDVSMDSAICVAGSRFVRAGLLATNCKGLYLYPFFGFLNMELFFTGLTCLIGGKCGKTSRLPMLSF